MGPRRYAARQARHNSGAAGAGNASYTGTLSASLPPFKDGNWRVIVRPDLYNEVFEGYEGYAGSISEGIAGLRLPPGEANNRSASGGTLQVSVPEMQIGTPLQTTLSPGQARLYKVAVAAGETLRVSLDADAAGDEGSNELYLRYGDLPSSYAFDAAYDRPLSADQEVWLPSTQAGDYYLLLRSRQGAANTPVTLRADLLPLSITRISPDQGGSGSTDNGGDVNKSPLWVSVDIEGAHFKPGALVKLTRPGVHELEPERWQVLDATRIRAIFDLRQVPLGLYDLSVINPDGQRVTEAQRFLVERGIEADVSIGIGGPRTLTPGENGLYSVSLQSLSNVDTPTCASTSASPKWATATRCSTASRCPTWSSAAMSAAAPTASAWTRPATRRLRPDAEQRHDPAGHSLGQPRRCAQHRRRQSAARLRPRRGRRRLRRHELQRADLPRPRRMAGLRLRRLARQALRAAPGMAGTGLLDGGVHDLDHIADGLAKEVPLAEPRRTPAENRKAGHALPLQHRRRGDAADARRIHRRTARTRRRLRTAILADRPHRPAWRRSPPTPGSGSPAGWRARSGRPAAPARRSAADP
jgi:hypothetical protein